MKFIYLKNYEDYQIVRLIGKYYILPMMTTQILNGFLTQNIKEIIVDKNENTEDCLFIMEIW